MSNGIKTIFKILLVIVVIMGLILPFLNLQAEEISDRKSATLEEINNLVGNLQDLKGNLLLSDAEKEAQELAIRLEAFSKLLDLALLETTDLKMKLESLELTNEKQIAVRDQFLKLLQEYEDYFNKVKEALNESLSLKDLKDSTMAFKAWRELDYNRRIVAIANFIAIFNERSILKTADARLEKIVSDLKKLESSKFINRQGFQIFLNAAAQNIGQAHTLNKQAEILLLNNFPNLSARTNDEIKRLTKESLNEIRAAYQNFFNISKRVKQQLAEK